MECIKCKIKIKESRKYCSIYCYRESIKGTKRPSMQNENNPNWKGDKVGYWGVHKWVQKELGNPMRCDKCERKDLSYRQYNWANISRKYKRDLSDWIRLCAKCHVHYDRNIKK